MLDAEADAEATRAQRGFWEMLENGTRNMK
jgi:hypothetical protein